MDKAKLLEKLGRIEAILEMEPEEYVKYHNKEYEEIGKHYGFAPIDRKYAYSCMTGEVKALINVLKIDVEIFMK